MDEAQENAALVERAFDVIFNQRRLDAIDEFYAEDFVQRSPYVGHGGRADLKTWLTDILASIPDLAHKTTRVISTGNQVVVFATVTGTFERDVPDYGIKAELQKVTFGTAHWLEVRDGKIVSHWQIADTGPLVRFASVVGPTDHQRSQPDPTFPT